MGGRFACGLKNFETTKELTKARYIAQGHKDRENPFFVHNVSTLRQSSTPVVISTAAVLGFRIFTHDVTQAYLHRKCKLTRFIFLKPRNEDRQFFKLKSDDLLCLQKQLFSICDSGAYWGKSKTTQFKGDLLMIPMIGGRRILRFFTWFRCWFHDEA